MAANSEQPPSGEQSESSSQERDLQTVERRQRDIRTGIDTIHEDAPNEQVEQLADLLSTMHSELCRLEAKNRQLETRLEKLETVNGLDGEESTLSEVSRLDHRDEKVVKAIVADGRERVSLKELRELYRNHTDIRAEETLRERTRDLTKRGPFEHEQRGLNSSVWRFTGLGN